jgi:1-acyl-sn-glycerol-3-phosphate acyltransferase
MIMPEGGRSHRPGMRRAEPGAAYIVEKTGVPVVPVGVVGTTDDFLSRALRGRRPHAQMIIGKSFHLPDVEGRGEERRLARQRNADLIMSHIAALLPPEYRGVYAEPDAPSNP